MAQGDCVQLESPFAGDRRKHILYAKYCTRDCLIRGEAPFVSHILYTQDKILEDDIPEERKLGMKAGFMIAERMDISAFYIDYDISNGMYAGILNAREKNRPIEYRSLVKPEDNEIYYFKACEAVKRVYHSKSSAIVVKDEKIIGIGIDYNSAISDAKLNKSSIEDSLIFYSDFSIESV